MWKTSVGRPVELLRIKALGGKGNEICPYGPPCYFVHYINILTVCTFETRVKEKICISYSSIKKDLLSIFVNIQVTQVQVKHYAF